MIWQTALCNVSRPRIVGIDSIASSDNSNPSRHLVLTYLGGYTDEWTYPFHIKYHYAIPADHDNAFQTFAYNGSGRCINDIINDIPQDKLESISTHRFSKEAYRLGKEIMDGKDVKWRGKGVNWYGSDISGVAVDGFLIEDRNVMLVPYCRSDAKISGVEARGFMAEWDRNMTLDPRLNFLILPYRQKRFAWERTKNIFAAAMYTPPFAICDALLVASAPLWIFEAF